MDSTTTNTPHSLKFTTPSTTTKTSSSSSYPSKPWTPASPHKLTHSHHSSASQTVSHFIHPSRHFFKEPTRRRVTEDEALRAFRSHVKSIECETLKKRSPFHSSPTQIASFSSSSPCWTKSTTKPTRAYKKVDPSLRVFFL
ncbi:hypothetical protein HMI55_001254 [Coelomomyces lativittatus]|nr:hypothetical protein HMI55_001254 [Coelomomyces lativittatus]